MPFSSFQKLNAEREDCGEEPFANPRNAASGSLKLQDPSEVAKRGLAFKPYFVLGEGLYGSTHFERMSLLVEWGFRKPDVMEIVHGLDGAFDFLNMWDVDRKTLSFPIDYFATH